jgi:hypothetical protein
VDTFFLDPPPETPVTPAAAPLHRLTWIPRRFTLPGAGSRHPKLAATPAVTPPENATHRNNGSPGPLAPRQVIKKRTRGEIAHEGSQMPTFDSGHVTRPCPGQKRCHGLVWRFQGLFWASGTRQPACTSLLCHSRERLCEESTETVRGPVRGCELRCQSPEAHPFR